MIRIYVLRHGEAVDATETGGSDRARVLTPRGRDTSTTAARGMGRLGITPAVILTSPYPRAAQTAELTASQLASRPPIERADQLMPGATPQQIAALLAERTEDELMLVGHNPDLEWLLAWLVSPGEDARLNLKKGALALVQSGRPPRAGEGSLRWLLTPSQLSRM